ncbi:MAG: PrsW family glutamic-type intramembrane protease [Bacteroidota bacterium]|nr:PrsW family glutamic-type intramembrane protease [Bacteroidota bacterium]
MLRLVTIASVPVILILAYVYHRDKYNKEPWWLLLFSFVGGALTVPPIIWWETAMLDIMPAVETVNQDALYVSFLVAGLCEETSKLIILLLVVYRSTHFNEKIDGIVYAVFVSLGFALVENIMYVVSGGQEVGLMRAITAVPAHAIFAIAMGFHLAKAKFSARKRYRHFALALLVPIILHGTYNYILMSESNYLLLTFVLYLFLLYRLGFKRMRFSIRNSAYRK